LLLPLLRRDDGEIAKRAAGFRIDDAAGRALVSDLGSAFLRGFNAMLELPGLRDVTEEGARVPVHFRPFYFEGAAMGYLPRGYYTRRFTAEQAERDLLGLDGAFLYLYYVGLGFWYGMRYPRRPDRLEGLARHLDPLYFPLCYDGFGFKVGFFDFPTRSSAMRVLERCPESRRPYIHQGFGRSLFFVYMNDPVGFASVKSALPDERRWDLEFGRSLAQGFTGIDRPRVLAEYLSTAADEVELSARLPGLTWALAARRMNDPEYFAECLGKADAPDRMLLEQLTDLCETALTESSDYGDWQSRTRDATVERYKVVRSLVLRGGH